MSTKNNPSASLKAVNKKSKKHQPQLKKAPLKVPEDNSDKWIWLTMGFILLTTFAIYFKVIKFDFLFTWDDNVYIRENNAIKDLQWENIKLFFTGFYSGNYQPVTILMYAIEYKLAGYSASLYHFNNILLHIVNTYLVFVLIRKISPESVIVALTTAAFFAVHPMHVESVAWVAERKDVLYSFFFLLSLIVYSNYLRTSKLILLILSGIFFTLSCLSKSAAVILPLLLLLFDYYSGRKYSWKMIVEKVPFFAISLIFGIVAMNSQNEAIQDVVSEVSLINRLSVISHSFLSYIFKAFIPVNLSAVYPYPPEYGGTLPITYYLSLLFLGFLLFFVWISRKWSKDIVFGFLFFVITIFLVLQFVAVGGATMADRYTYIPYIGLFFITGKLVEYLSDSAHFKKILAALIFAFIIFSSISNIRTKIWANDEILFNDVIKKYPNCIIAHFNRGIYCLNYNAQIAFANNNAKKTLNLVNAIKDFDETIKLNEKFSGVNFYRGCAKFLLKDYTNALKDFDKALLLNPKDANGYFNRGNTKKEINDFTGAIKDYNKTIELNPTFINAYNNRSMLKCMLKDYEGTIADYDKMIELNPNDTTTIKNRKIIRALLENSKK
jgi:protein O-mannosyl-transferase